VLSKYRYPYDTEPGAFSVRNHGTDYPLWLRHD